MMLHPSSKMYKNNCVLWCKQQTKFVLKPSVNLLVVGNRLAGKSPLMAELDKGKSHLFMIR